MTNIARPSTRPEKELRQALAEFARMTGQSRRASGWRYLSIEALVLAHGRFADATRIRSDRRGRVRKCFKNALDAAASAGDLTYVEGYALPQSLPLPILHAWCIDDGGALVEPTWGEPGAAYLGIPLALPFVFDTVSRRNRYGVLDAPELRWPLLQHGLPADALAVSTQTARLEDCHAH